MSTAEKAAPTYSFQRTIPLEDAYDLIVAGGGPGGCGAAICAARLGAKVLLVEGTGCLGGMGTSGLVSAWSDLADGEETLLGGLMFEIIEEMYKRGNFRSNVTPERWRKTLHGGLGYNPEGLKILLDELCVKAGVELRFFTRVIDADVTGKRVNGVIINNVEGSRYIKARAFIDATGDAVLSDLCGAAYREAGRDTPNIMPPTLCAEHAGIQWDTFDYPKQQEAIFQGVREGRFSQPDRHVPGLFEHGCTTGIMNAGHLFGTNAVKCRSLSDGMIRGRQLAWEYARFYREFLEGCENLEFVCTGSLLGVRESRRIVGEYELNHDDFTNRRSFPDQIAIYNKSVDIHVYDCSDEQWERYRAEFLKRDRPGPREHYGLPYGILVPRGWENLWVAGRCNSSDIKVHGAIRDQPACFMMGEAAGTAAVQSIKTGQPACDLNTTTLVETLRARGGNQPQKELSTAMTRTC